METAAASQDASITESRSGAVLDFVCTCLVMSCSVFSLLIKELWISLSLSLTDIILAVKTLQNERMNQVGSNCLEARLHVCISCLDNNTNSKNRYL